MLALPSLLCRWRDIDASPAWQRGAFDGLAVAYGALAIVALVSPRRLRAAAWPALQGCRGRALTIVRRLLDGCGRSA